jgi:hypothetical protein
MDIDGDDDDDRNGVENDCVSVTSGMGVGVSLRCCQWNLINIRIRILDNEDDIFITGFLYREQRRAQHCTVLYCTIFFATGLSSWILSQVFQSLLLLPVTRLLALSRAMRVQCWYED